MPKTNQAINKERKIIETNLVELDKILTRIRREFRHQERMYQSIHQKDNTKSFEDIYSYLTGVKPPTRQEFLSYQEALEEYFKLPYFIKNELTYEVKNSNLTNEVISIIAEYQKNKEDYTETNNKNLADFNELIYYLAKTAHEEKRLIVQEHVSYTEYLAKGEVPKNETHEQAFPNELNRINTEIGAIEWYMDVISLSYLLK